MHGLGNDFIVINNTNGRIQLSKNQIIALCDRHKGIGADGVILVESSLFADCFMNYYNSDGTQESMCGNGVRCVAKFFIEEISTDEVVKNILKIDTRAGIKEVEIFEDNNFAVNMGKPIFTHTDFVVNKIEIEDLSLDCVNVGNPHAVAFVDNLDKYDLFTLGPKIENHKNFPRKTNFELVQKTSNDNYKLKVWERGCGITLACGTGATATYAILRNNNSGINKVMIDMPGGRLLFSENKDGDIIMRGGATTVFNSVVNL